MAIDKICKRCGKHFQVDNYRKDTARFCSYSCSNSSKIGVIASNWRGGRKVYICRHCGKEFSSYLRLGGIKPIFCSRSCASRFSNSGNKSHLWKGGRKHKICPHCGINFLVDPGDVIRKYCSKKCLDEARQKRTELICANCGKKYIRQISRSNRSEENFCSRKCYGIYLGVHQAGKNNPAWNGGHAYEPYSDAFNEPFKRMIRERDNYTCAICGKSGKTVHHINYVKDDTCPENCVTLCHSCHSKTNSNREYWQSFFNTSLLRSLLKM